MPKIEIKKISITSIIADAIVNAANEGLWEGGGVCGYIFKAAGSGELTKACQAIGHCDTGNAVITPGFHSKAKYIIHAVGPRWHGGQKGEDKLLYNAYQRSLLLAKDKGCHSIAFPLISAGIFAYPKKEAWRIALTACNDFLNQYREYNLKVTFTILEDDIIKLGQQEYDHLTKNA